MNEEITLNTKKDFPLKSGIELNEAQKKFLNITTMKESDILKRIVSNQFTMKKIDIIFDSVINNEEKYFPLIKTIISNDPDFSYTFDEVVERIKDERKGFSKDNNYELYSNLLKNYISGGFSLLESDIDVLDYYKNNSLEEIKYFEKLKNLVEGKEVDNICIPLNEMKAIFTLNSNTLSAKQINNLQNKLYYLSYELGFGDIQDYSIVGTLDSLMPKSFDNYKPIEVKEVDEESRLKFIENYFEFQKNLNKHYDIFDFTKPQKTIHMEYVTGKLELLNDKFKVIDEKLKELNDFGKNMFGEEFKDLGISDIKEKYCKKVFSNIEDFYGISSMSDSLKSSSHYHGEMHKFLLNPFDYDTNYSKITEYKPLDVFIFFEKFRDINPQEITLKDSLEQLKDSRISVSGKKITIEAYNLYTRNDTGLMDIVKLNNSKILHFVRILYILEKNTVIEGLGQVFGNYDQSTGENIKLSGFSEEDIVFKGTKSDKFSFTINNKDLLQKLLSTIPIENLS